MSYAVVLCLESITEKFIVTVWDIKQIMKCFRWILDVYKRQAMDRPDAKTIPIIAMTANAFEEDAKRCLAAGMTAHLAKPCLLYTSVL